MFRMSSRRPSKKAKKRVKFILPLSPSLSSNVTESADWHYSRFDAPTIALEGADKKYGAVRRTHWHTVPPQRRCASLIKRRNRTELLQRARSANSDVYFDLNHRFKPSRSRSLTARTEILHISESATTPLKYRWKNSALRDLSDKVTLRPYIYPEIIRKYPINHSVSGQYFEKNVIRLPATLSQFISPLTTNYYNYILPQKRSLTFPQYYSRSRSPRKGSSAVVNSSGMDLQYVTERILVMLFVSDGTDAQYRTGLKDASVFLRRNHSDHYKIFNVSKKRSDLGRIHPVVELGWPQELAPPLDRLCSICKMLENWLSGHPENVIVIHCKEGRSRVAVVLSAYMHYITICAVEASLNSRFSLERFSGQYLDAEGQPSHKRYVKYFSALLSGKTKINPTALHLHHIILSKFAGRNVLFKIYEHMQPVFTTQLMTVSEQSTIDLGDLRLRGDILVKCFQRTSTAERSPFFRCQFNTCTFDLNNSDGKTYVLRFYKDDLDDLDNGGEIDAQASLEFVFVIDAANDSLRRSITDYSRADSYENFDKEEEDRNEPLATDRVAVECADIHRPTDSTDSGIGSDSANTSKDKNGMPPLPPPKPRINIENQRNEHLLEINRGNEQVATRAHSVLPASVRPSPTIRPASPGDGRTTPRIEPDLVAKDRYDPASRCFSYVPARALNEHFTTPKKPTQWQKAEESPVEAVMNLDPSPSEIASVPVKSTELQRRPDTPKWEDRIDKISKSDLLGERSGMVNGSAVPNDSTHTIELIANATPKAESSKGSSLEEKPIVVEQAQRVTKRRKTKYDSYKTLNDDAYNSDMDDLCDPDFYLSYAPQAMTTNSTGSNAPNTSGTRLVDHSLVTIATTNGQKSINEQRRPLKDLSQEDRPIPATKHFSSPKPATSLSDLNLDRDTFRMRNCRSAASAPFRRESGSNRLFGNDRYDSLTDAENADDWLQSQLRKLKARRENNPEMVRRRRQEKLLLEELKHVSDRRTGDERSYTVEGYGQRSDPLMEYKQEEQRLRNVRSPYLTTKERDDQSYTIRRVLPPRANDVVRHKPPTPPPRARSRSPPASPYLRRSRTRTPSQDTYQRERYHGYRNDERGMFDFEELNHYGSVKSTTTDNSVHADNTSAASMKSILKKRDGPNGNSTVPSSVVTRRGSTPSEEWSAASNRATTPAFPVRRETPLPYHPLLFEGASNAIPSQPPVYQVNYRSETPKSAYYAQSQRTSLTSTEAGEVIHHHPLFVKDTSKYWYKPTISREEAINMLKDKLPGTFVVRDSNSFPGAFGLALKVATPPPGVHPGDGTELVRHFLIEPSPKGVRLKGCSNEPVFGTLSALVYQHSITPLALPTKLLLPDYDPASTPEHISAAQALLQQGAACNVTYIISLDTESLTGPEAVRRCIGEAFGLLQQKMIHPVSVHFKVSSQGVTITDNTRRLFFRRHYPVQSVTHAGIDPEDRRWDNSYLKESLTSYVKSARIFAFVARKIGSRTDNACHVFAELDPEQPATAVVNFINKVMLGQ